MNIKSSASVGLLIILMLVTIMPIESQVSADGTGNYPAPGFGDWHITTDTYVGNETIFLTGNLWVEAGVTLTLYNAILRMDVNYDGQFNISVNGTLNMRDSMITNINGVNRYHMQYNSGSAGLIEHCNISHAGWSQTYSGFRLSSTNVQVFNSSFDNGYIGIRSGDAILINNTITNMDMYGMMLSFSPTIKDNTIYNSDNAGIRLGGFDGVISNTTLDGCYLGVYSAISDCTFDNCTLKNTLQESITFTADSDIVFLNTTDDSKFYFFGDAASSLTTQWYMNAEVTDTSDMPIDGAVVRMRDNSNGTYDGNFTTDSSGWAKWIVVNESYETQTGKILYTPHNITVTKGIIHNDTVPDQTMNQSKWISIILEDNTQPTIISVNPSNASIGIPVGTTINVQFSENMNQSSTQTAFSLRKNGTAIDVPGVFGWSGTTMAFTPNVDLDYLSTYTCNMTTAAMDSNGNNLAALYSWYFSTETPDLTPPTVVSHRPIGTGIQVSTDINIRFSEDMNTTATQNAFNITPYVPGIFAWTNADNLTFTPNGNLSYGTVYNVRLNGSIACDVNGNFLDGNANGTSEGYLIDDYNWTFETQVIPPPQITIHSPTGTNVESSDNITVCFDMEMNEASVESSFNITPYVTGTFSWNSTQNLTFEPAIALEYDTQYTIKLNSSIAKDAVGNLLDGNGNGTAEGSPDDDYAWSFTTEQAPDITPPQVMASSPTGTGISIIAPITIRFDEPMNTSSVEGGFSIVPPVSGAFGWSENNFTFTPSQNMTYNTSYVVKLNSTIAKDLAENTLDGDGDGASEGSPVDDYTWSFTTLPDTLPPAQVDDLAAATGPTDGSVVLSWTATGDDGMYGTATEYDVRYSLAAITDSNWQDATAASGEPIPGASGTAETMTIAGLQPGETYYFALKVLDDAGNPSNLSNVANGAANDLSGPVAPTGLTATPQDDGILLEWNAVADSDLDHYVVYRSSNDVTYTAIGNVTAGTENYLDTDVTEGTSYYYKLKAVDDSDNESPFSSSVLATWTGPDEIQTNNTMLYIAIIVIVVLAIIGILWFLKKGGKTEPISSPSKEDDVNTGEDPGALNKAPKDTE